MLGLILALSLSLLPLACCAPSPPASRLDASCGLLAVAGPVLRDACGRTRLFRGVNAVQKGWPWLPETHAFSPFTSLAPPDYPFLRSWGVNALRLGAMWPGWEPAIGVHNASYLTALADVVAAAGAGAGIYSLLDAHQDALSGAFCGEGVPDQYAVQWAAGSQPFPMPLLPAGFPPNASSPAPTAAQCASIDWTAVYFSSAAGRAFDVLYNGAQARAAFGAFWGNVSSTFAQRRPDADPWVLGYELLNEPWAGDTALNPALLIPGVADRVNLQPWYSALAEHVRGGEAGSSSHHPLFLEAVTWDDFLPVGFSALPGAGGGRDSSGGAVLSYHFYSYVNIEGAEGQVGARVADATRLHAAAMLTEFDMAQSPEDMTQLLAACDRHSQGYISWEYKQ
jgi:endoglycosylceramidase